MGKLKTFEEFLNDKSDKSISENKNDFMARYGKTDIWIKKGYKHADDELLSKMYDEIGNMLKKYDIPVKTVTVVTESLDVNEHHGDEWPNVMLSMPLSGFLDKVKETDETKYNQIEELIANLVDMGLMK
jgi:hypothetical protein